MFNVTFPEDYNSEELKGKAAVFKCTVHKIETRRSCRSWTMISPRMFPSSTLWKSTRTSLREDLKKKKEDEAKREKENAAVDKAVANAQMEIPDAMLDTQAAQMVDNFRQKAQRPGHVHGAVHAVYRPERRGSAGADEAPGPESRSRPVWCWRR